MFSFSFFFFFFCYFSITYTLIFLLTSDKTADRIDPSRVVKSKSSDGLMVLGLYTSIIETRPEIGF